MSSYDTQRSASIIQADPPGNGSGGGDALATAPTGRWLRPARRFRGTPAVTGVDRAHLPNHFLGEQTLRIVPAVGSHAQATYWSGRTSTSRDPYCSRPSSKLSRITSSGTRLFARPPATRHARVLRVERQEREPRRPAPRTRCARRLAAGGQVVARSALKAHSRGCCRLLGGPSPRMIPRSAARTLAAAPPARPVLAHARSNSARSRPGGSAPARPGPPRSRRRSSLRPSRRRSAAAPRAYDASRPSPPQPLQTGRQLPAQVDGVLQAGVQAEPAIRRVLWHASPAMNTRPGCTGWPP